MKLNIRFRFPDDNLKENMPLKEWLTKKHEKHKRSSRSRSDDSILTDDPLSTLVYPNGGHGSTKSVEQIYAVSRVNPIFDDSDVISVGKIPNSSNGSGVLDDLDEGQEKEPARNSNSDDTSSSNSAVVRSVSSGFWEASDDDNQHASTGELESAIRRTGSSEEDGSSSDGDVLQHVSSCLGDSIEELADDSGTSCNIQGHDTESCLGISGLVPNKAFKDIEIHEPTFVEEIVKKRQNLRHISQKTALMPDIQMRSGIVNYSEALSAVSSDWRRSVDTLRKIWRFDEARKIEDPESISPGSSSFVSSSSQAEDVTDQQIHPSVEHRLVVDDFSREEPLQAPKDSDEDTQEGEFTLQC